MFSSNYDIVKGYEYDEYGNTTDDGEESFINEVTFTGSVSEENVSWWNKAADWVSNAASDAWEWVKNAAIDVGDFVVDTIDSISNYFEENPEAANIAKGLGVIALAGVVVLATGGTGAGVVGVIATKAFQGAVLGSVTGGTVGMGVEVIKDRIETGSWDGWMEAAYRGGAQGFGDGSTTGFIAGGFSSMIGVMRSNRIMSKTTGMCFVAGTEVHTEEGKERIEEIEAGDRVWAEDPETGEKGIKTVVRTFERETDELVRVYAGGEEIITTAEHPFYVPKRGWTAAIELRAGDVLVNVNGEYVILEKIEHELLESPVKVYNFEVEDFHTYYVGDSGVLVHNMCAQTIKPISPKKIKPGQLKDVDVHKFKLELTGKKAMSRFDIYQDTANDGILWLGNKNKANTIWVNTGLKMSDLRTIYPG